MINLIAAVGVFDIIVSVLIGVAVVAVIGRIIYKKATGKSVGCGCGCDGCKGCSHCKDLHNK